MNVFFKSVSILCCMSFAAQAMQQKVGEIVPAGQSSCAQRTDSLERALQDAARQGRADTLRELLSRADQALIPAACTALQESANNLAILNRLADKIAVCTAPEETGPYALVVDHLELSGEDSQDLYEIFKCSDAYDSELVKVSETQCAQGAGTSSQSLKILYKVEVKKHYASVQERYEAARKGYKEVAEILAHHLKSYCARYIPQENVEAFFSDPYNFKIIEAFVGVLKS